MSTDQRWQRGEGGGKREESEAQRHKREGERRSDVEHASVAECPAV